MRDIEAQFRDADAQIIWMLQENPQFQSATSQDSHNFYSTAPNTSGYGIRVGDAETEPVAGAFEASPFIPPSSNRGFAMVVRKSDMQIVFADFHGNERNLTAQDLLAAAQAENVE